MIYIYTKQRLKGSEKSKALGGDEFIVSVLG